MGKTRRRFRIIAYLDHWRLKCFGVILPEYDIAMRSIIIHEKCENSSYCEWIRALVLTRMYDTAVLAGVGHDRSSSKGRSRIRRRQAGLGWLPA